MRERERERERRRGRVIGRERGGEESSVHFSSISMMTLIGCWCFTVTPAQNGVVIVGSKENTPLRPDPLVGEFTKVSESRISETT